MDAISSFIADELDMKKLGAGAVITGAQKALALHPGLSVIALSPEGVERVERNEEICMYLSLKEALKNGERGQTPFTPAVTVLLELHERLVSMAAHGGITEEQARIRKRAQNFRRAIAELPFDFASESMSNAVTALHPRNVSAKKIFNEMKKDYNIWICPNGGNYAESVFRVGHIGNITVEQENKLIAAFTDMNRKGRL